ncbi:MAG: ChbG/HpnK family deacetylase [bacterium]
MGTARRLLITCDDLGYHPAFNQAIVDILRDGIIRATSLMSVGPHVDDALRRLAAAGIDAVGVHLTLGSEYAPLPVRPLSPPHLVPSLVREDGRFLRDISRTRERIVVEEVAREFRAQIESVRATGLRLTHVDGHMFCYESELGGAAILAVARHLACEYGLPLRVRGATRNSPTIAEPPVYMRWHHETAAARHAFYSAFLAAYDDPLAELIIHPGVDAAAMQTFCRTGERRIVDYTFFRSDEFRAAIFQRGIEIVGRDDL